MKDTCFSEVDKFPALEPGMMRLYNMRFCPFARRTRLVLEHKNIPYEAVNINLKSKPDWFLEKNPLGLVPTLEQDSRVVYESAVCNQYLDAIYPDPALQPTDPYLKAHQAMLMERFGKVTSAGFKISRGSGEDKDGAIEDFKKAIKVFEDALEETFFGGANPQMIDFHMWPFFEWWQSGELLQLVDGFPKMKQWKSAMMEVPAVKATYLRPEVYAEMQASSARGAPDYDTGLTS